MAPATKTAAATGGGTTSTPRPSRVASMLPEDMVSSGLADDFDATIEKSRYIIWNYGGARKEFSLAVRWDVRPDDPEDPSVAPFVDKETGLYSIPYSAGSLKNFVPSADGEQPAGGSEEDYLALAEGRTAPEPGTEHEYEGIYAYATEATFEKAARANRSPEMSKGTVWEQAIQAALDAGFPKDEAGSGRVDVFEGARVHFNRVPKKARVSDKGGDKGAAANASGDGQKQRANDVLVVTEYRGKEGQAAGKGGTKSATTKATGKPNGTPAAAAGDFRADVVEAVCAALAEHGGDTFTMPKQSLSPRVMAAFDGPAKAKAIGLLGQDDFRMGYPDRFTWNADDATFTLTV